MALTNKQEAFCLAYIDGANASDAYRAAYDTKRMKPETVNNSAYQLLQNHDIAARLEEIRNAAAEKAAISLESHLSDLKQLRDSAVLDGKWSAAVSAEIARGKAAGLYVEKSEITGKNGGPITTRADKDLTDDELAAELARYGIKP